MRGRFHGSIELKFVAATTIILALAIATVTFLHVQDMRAASRREAEADVTAGVRVQHEALQGELHKYAEDVKVLANTPPVEAIQRALANGGIDPESGDSYDVWRDRLAEILEAFLAEKRSYMQARYLNSSGTEIVRVDRRDGRVVRIPDGELQNKSGRGYSMKPRELLSGEVYVSPLDLNVEQGEIADPHVPSIRFATPVHDPSGRFGGTLVTNIFASELLARIGAVERGTAYIIDSTGQYIFHPDESRTFGGELGTGIDVAGDLGADAAAEITAGAGTLTAAGQLLAYAPVDFAGLSTTNEWQLVRAVALAELPAPSLVKPIAAAVILLLAGGIVAYLVARGVSRSLRRSEERLQAVLTTSPDAIIGCDARGTVTYASERVREVLGWEPEDLVGQPLDVLMPEHLKDRHAQGFRDSMGTGGTRAGINGEAVRQDGRVIPVDISIARLEESRAGLEVVATIRDVAERLEIQTALAESEERFRAVVEFSKSGIHVADVDGKILLANPALCDMLGYTREELDGTSALTHVHPDDREAAAAQYGARVRGDEPPGAFSRRILRKDGRAIVVESVASVITYSDGRVETMCSHQDVTAQNEALREIREINARYQTLVQAIPDLMFQISSDGTYLDFHPGAVAPHVPPEQFLGKRVVDVMPTEVAAQTMSAIATTIESGEPQAIEFQLESNNGLRDWEARFFRAGADEVIAISRDVSDQRQAARDRELAHRSTVRSEFLATMSHELRSPLNAILGFAELLLESRKEPLNGRHRSHVGDILSAGQHLLSLINDILDFEKIDAGRYELTAEPFNPATLIETVAHEYEGAANERGLELRVSVEEAPPEVVADERAVRQILVNLVSNALRFTDDGYVEVRARGSGDQLVLAVEDSGIGISAEQQDRIFEAFSQLDSGLNRRYGGTGLGLAITKQLVELHGGEIAVASTPGRGSTFTVRLPLDARAEMLVAGGAGQPNSA